MQRRAAADSCGCAITAAAYIGVSRVSLFLRAFLTTLQAFRKLLRASWQAFSSASPAAAGLEKLLRLPWTLLGLPLRTFRGLWVGGRAAFWLSELPRGSGSAEVRVSGFLGLFLSLSSFCEASPELPGPLLSLSWASPGPLLGASQGFWVGGRAGSKCVTVAKSGLSLACCWLVADLLLACCRPVAGLKPFGGEGERTSFWSKMHNCRQNLARSLGTPVMGGG